MDALSSPASATAPIDSFRTRLYRRWFVLRACLLALFLIAAWFWPVGSQYVEIPPSFPCATATVPTEKTICADPLLEKIDADFTTYYRESLDAATLFQATAKIRELKKSETDFIAARNRCRRNRWCIERQYLYQDIRITDMIGGPHPTTVPLRVYLNHYVGAYLKYWIRGLLHRSSRAESHYRRLSPPA